MFFSMAAKKSYFKFRKFFGNLRDCLKANISRPNFLASSNALGIFCAMLPVIGQSYLCFLLWLLMRRFKATQFSIVISEAWTLLTIPVFMPFILFGYYKTGCAIMSNSPISFGEFLRDAKDIIKTSTDWGHVMDGGFKFAFDDIGAPLFLGASICILTAASCAYLATYFGVKFYTNNRIKREN